MDNRKKQYERWFLDRLKSEVLDFPRGEILDHERPDFLVCSGQGTLGIEVSRLFKKQSSAGRDMLATDSERRTIVEMAQRFYQQASTVPTRVSVLFSGSHAPTKADRDRLSKQITDLVLSNIPGANNWSRIDIASCGASFPVEISSIQIARFDGLTHSLWDAPPFGRVQENFPDELQSAIHEKVIRLAEYLTQCDRCWLLIVSDASGASAFFRASQDTLRHQYQSTFERTYFHDTLSQKVFRLSTSANGV